MLSFHSCTHVMSAHPFVWSKSEITWRLPVLAFCLISVGFNYCYHSLIKRVDDGGQCRTLLCIHRYFSQWIVMNLGRRGLVLDLSGWKANWDSMMTLTVGIDVTITIFEDVTDISGSTNTRFRPLTSGLHSHCYKPDLGLSMVSSCSRPGSKVLYIRNAVLVNRKHKSTLN